MLSMAEIAFVAVFDIHAALSIGIQRRHFAQTRNDVLERIHGIVQIIKQFIMTFGRGFSFVGN